jgi:hypothetical protein
VEQFPEGKDPVVNTFGAIHVRLILPDQPAATKEPLLVTGAPGAGDFVYLEYGDAGQVRFAFDHWSGAGATSPTISLSRDAPHDVEIMLPSLFPPDPDIPLEAASSGTLTIHVDGVAVWTERVACYRPGVGQIFVATNPIGGTSCSERFSGSVLRAERTKSAH